MSVNYKYGAGFCLLSFFASARHILNRFVRLSLALASSDFNNRKDDKYYVSIGTENGEPHLYENYWTDNQYYVCQYERE